MRFAIIARYFGRTKVIFEGGTVSIMSMLCRRNDDKVISVVDSSEINRVINYR